MPWQPVPSFIIIGGAFNVAAGLIWGAHRLGYGEVRVPRRFVSWNAVVQCGWLVTNYSNPVLCNKHILSGSRYSTTRARERVVTRVV
jgi:hypothetical protein